MVHTSCNTVPVTVSILIEHAHLMHTVSKIITLKSGCLYSYSASSTFFVMVITCYVNLQLVYVMNPNKFRACQVRNSSYCSIFLIYQL